jgi:hypothetical protein
MNSFDMKASIGLCVTSYEQNKNKKYEPIMSHIFWGNNLEQAISYAKSHLISDLFFSSTFIGTMPWKDTMLYIAYDGEILTSQENDDIEKILDSLSEKAEEINYKQEKSGMIQIVQKLSSMKI